MEPLASSREGHDARTTSNFLLLVKERSPRRTVLAFKTVDETGLQDELPRPECIDIELTIPPARRDTCIDEASAMLVGDRVRNRPVRVDANRPPYRSNAAEDEVLDGSSKSGCSKGHVIRPKKTIVGNVETGCFTEHPYVG